jgi:hypothetical protein
VHAITRYKEFEHWKSFIQDRKVYVLYNCQVYDNELGLKPCEGPFKVVFGSGTNIKPAPEITNIPDQDFWFKNFKEANDGNFKINVLYGTFVLQVGLPVLLFFNNQITFILKFITWLIYFRDHWRSS